MTAPSVTPYSLRQVVTDGALTAPRWLQHVVKLCCQHAAPAFGLWAITGRPLLAALLCGPAVFVGITIHEKFWPSDPAKHTLWQHVADAMTDGALATVPVVVALVATHRLWYAAALAAGLIASYVAGHRDARP